MLTIGVDAHKEVHVAVAVDVAGQEVGRWQGPNAAEGWDALAAWAQALAPERRWGIEGAGNYGRGLAQHLVGCGERVFEVNPRLTAQGRRRARRRDKSDRLDAQAVATAVLRYGEELPEVHPEDETAVLDLPVTERQRALAEATRLRNQLHHVLFQVDPLYNTTLV